MQRWWETDFYLRKLWEGMWGGAHIATLALNVIHSTLCLLSAYYVPDIPQGADICEYYAVWMPPLLPPCLPGAFSPWKH